MAHDSHYQQEKGEQNNREKKIEPNKFEIPVVHCGFSASFGESSLGHKEKKNKQDFVKFL